MNTLHVCISCRYQAEQRFCAGKRGGQILFERLETEVKEAGLDLNVKPSDCLSACRNFCALAFTGHRKMSMVFGRLDVAAEPEQTVEALLKFSKAYCDKSDGLILRADRPLILQDKLITRIPPPEGLK